MKQYINKPTGKIAYEYHIKDGVQWYAVVGETTILPQWTIGSEWEEIKPEPEVPPDIVSFKNPATGGIIYNTGNTYEYWVRKHWVNYKDSINSIRVNDTIWEVYEVVGVKWSDRKVRITDFKWNGFHWMFGYDDSLYSMSISNAEKLPIKKPIVTLQGKDMYEGDSYWMVRNWEIFEHKLKGPLPVGYSLGFNSKELAENFVRDNKPVYPEGLVEKLIEACADHVVYKDYHREHWLRQLVDKLKAFKK